MQFDDWFWLEQQSDFENQMKLIPHHFLSDRLRDVAVLKKAWSLQKTTRTVSAVLLWLKVAQEISSWGDSK